jgi:alpha-tubulin suppressor-like RCC1 family protein
VVSAPLPDLTPTASRATISRVVISALDPSVVYVSLPPGAIPNGVSATIHDVRTDASVSAMVVDGGFDPVSLPAIAGDTITVVVHATGAASPQSLVFTVPAHAPPVVIRTDPPPHKRDVPLNSIVVIVFSEPLDSATVDTGSVQLWRGTTLVPGTVRFADALHLRAEFHPDTLLASQTDYQLVVTTAIRDLNGLALDSAVIIPFTTGTTVPATGLVFASVSVGFLHSCGVTTAGAAYCWGAQSYGQLGNGTIYTSALSPVPVSGGLTFEAVSASLFATCGVTTSGAAYCWGSGGSLGDTIGTNNFTPLPVSGGLTFTSVSAGITHSCGVTTAGAAYCWGGGSYGELGDGTTNSHSSTPVPVAGGLTFAAVSAEGSHSCGVTTTGVAYCWGMNTMGELGVGTSTGPEQCQSGGSVGCSTIPVAVAGGLTFKTVSTAGFHSCGVTTSGVPYCWGENLFDLLGSGTPPSTGPEQCDDTAGIYDWGPSVIPCSLVPVPVAGGLNLASLTTGGQDQFACGLTSTGVAYCWGYPQNVVDRNGHTAPVAVPGGLTFATLSAGLGSTCGVTPAGVAYCWGANLHGELGDGTTAGSNVPVKVAGQP